MGRWLLRLEEDFVVQVQLVLPLYSPTRLLQAAEFARELVHFVLEDWVHYVAVDSLSVE